MDALGDKTEVGFLKGVVEFDEGKPPIVLSGRNERGHDGGLALTVAGGEIVGHKVAQCHAATREGSVLA